MALRVGLAAAVRAVPAERPELAVRRVLVSEPQKTLAETVALIPMEETGAVVVAELAAQVVSERRLEPITPLAMAVLLQVEVAVAAVAEERPAQTLQVAQIAGPMAATTTPGAATA